MRPTTETPALSGQLEAIPLFDLCQFLMINRRTGTLTVRNGDAVARIYFEDGSILDIMDEALHTGEKILLAAVQWTSGSFTFDPTPPGVQRRITDSTEAILLEAARTIDENREQADSASPRHTPTQQEVFRERQTFAGDLAEAFRAAVEPSARYQIRDNDPLDALLQELRKERGTALIRGHSATVRGEQGVREYPLAKDATDILRQLGLPTPAPGDVHNHRLRLSYGWFHLRSRRFAGEIQIGLTFLVTDIPKPTDIGLDSNALEPLLERDGGLVLWTGLPRGLRSRSLESWLAHRPSPAHGPVLWLEEMPRAAWESVGQGRVHYAGDPSCPDARAALLDWGPDLVVIDSIRTPAAAELALETAEAGITTLAVSTGLTIGQAIRPFLQSLVRGGIGDGGARLAWVFNGWVGLVPIRNEQDHSALVATQIRLPDPTLSGILGREILGREIEEWALAHRPFRGLADDLDRLHLAGKIDLDLKNRLLNELKGLLT